ncbi:hypothetical protein GGR52DRAFT_344842 [Hypoxylon sp. FL1284]|nr:hypothetical protein GGR52DRAFT_344842 [Hypoxylon sp. FL1284]
MSSWGPSLRERASYAPDFPSPLNPSSPEPALSRCRRGRVARSEQSPTQLLMRHKAAVAWRSMASREARLKASIKKTRDDIYANVTSTNEQKKKEDRSLARAATTTATTKYKPLVVIAERYEEIDLYACNIDTEKQGFADNDYRDVPFWTSSYLSHLLTTRRLATAVGFVLFIGILSAVRAIGRVQAWRTW